MAINYTWAFQQFEVAPSSDGLTDVVRVIHWRLDALDGIYSAGAYGTVALSAPDPDSFTAYEDITEQWAIDVVTSNIEYDSIISSLEGEINKKKNPPTIAMTPPFAS